MEKLPQKKIHLQKINWKLVIKMKSLACEWNDENQHEVFFLKENEDEADLVFIIETSQQRFIKFLDSPL